MANFDANIDVVVNSSAALRGVQQVEKAFEKLNKQAAKFAEIFGSSKVDRALTNTVKQTVAIGRALRASKTAAAEFNAELIRTERILQSIQRGQQGQRALPAARGSAGALPPGRTAGLLPAAGGTGAASGNAPFERATAQARAVDQAAYSAATQASIKAANDLTRTIESEVTARRKAAVAVEKVTAKTDRTAQKLLSPGVVPPSGGSASPLGVNTSGTVRKQQILQKEVDRQIRVMGGVSNEMLETVAKYNKLQDSSERLVKTQNRLSTELRDLPDKMANQYNRPIGPQKAKPGQPGYKGGGKGGGGGMGGLGAGIGFPLLFGGGPGSVIGGAVGSAGGFGTQILASAIGGIIDQTVANIAKLGQALNPLTADIDAVVKASGESSTAFGQLVKQLEEVAGKEKALAAATAQLATVIGQDGVDSLREFGEETTALGNAASEALSQVAAAVADLINGAGILKGITATIDRQTALNAAASSNDPEIKELRKQLAAVPQGSSKEGTADVDRANIEDRIVARQRELQLLEQTKVLDEANAVIAKAKAKDLKAQLRVLQAENEVIKSGNSLLEEAAYQAQRRLIFAQTRAEVEAGGFDAVKTGVALAKEKNALEQLAAKRAKEQAAFNDKANKDAEKSLEKQLALTRKIANAKIAADLAARINDLQIQPDPTPFSRALSPEEVEVNKLQLQQAKNEAAIGRIKNSNLDIAEEQLRLDEQSEKNQLARTVIQGEATKAIRQRIEDQTKLIEGAETELKLAEAKTDVDKFEIGLASEVRDLRRSSLDLTDEQIEQYKKLKRATFEALNPSPLKAYMDQLEENLYGVDAVEKRIVEMSQAISSAISSSLSSAIIGVIDGTKSVEEAFADMFAGIGKAFIDMATQILAQKAILMLLQAFTGPNYKGVPGGRGPQFMGPAYAGGGYTGDAPRTGGVDGKGGFPAILHPQETVIDHYDDARSAMSTSATNNAAFAASAEAMLAASSNYAYNTTNNSYSSSSNSSSSTTNGTGTSNNSSTTIQLQTQVINQVEYATVEEVNKSLQATAKKTEANVYRSMRNKPATRNRVGV